MDGNCRPAGAGDNRHLRRTTAPSASSYYYGGYARVQKDAARLGIDTGDRFVSLHEYTLLPVPAMSVYAA